MWILSMVLCLAIVFGPCIYYLRLALKKRG